MFDIPVKKLIKSSYVREKAGQGTDISVCALSGCCFHEQLALRANFRNYSMGVSKCQWIFVQQKISKEVVQTPQLGQHRTIPALRLKHRSGSCGTASAAPRSPYRHLELCGIAFIILYNFTLYPLLRRDARCFSPTVDCCHARHGAEMAWFALIFYCVYIIIKLFYCLIFRATPHNSRLAA